MGCQACPAKYAAIAPADFKVIPGIPFQIASITCVQCPALSCASSSSCVCSLASHPLHGCLICHMGGCASDFLISRAQAFGCTLCRYRAWAIDPENYRGKAPPPMRASLPFDGTTTNREMFKGWQLPPHRPALGVQVGILVYQQACRQIRCSLGHRKTFYQILLRQRFSWPALHLYSMSAGRWGRCFFWGCYDKAIAKNGASGMQSCCSAHLVYMACRWWGILRTCSSLQTQTYLRAGVR